MRGRFASVSLATLVATVLVAGCGGQGQTGAQTNLLITREFGAAVVSDETVPVSKGLTAMRQLQSKAELKTAYGGRFVSSINGLAGGDGSDWLFFVDGVASDKGADEVRLKGGELVQWDFHPWQLVKTEGAIVGAYPEPLASRGVKLECFPTGDAICEETKSILTADGVDTDSASGAVRFFVGTWNDLKSKPDVPQLASSGAENGVFASVSDSEDSLELTGANGNVVRTVGDDAGLVAAVRSGDQVTWMLTGLTPTGVSNAVRTLERGALRGRFAIVATGEELVPLPAVVTESSAVDR